MPLVAVGANKKHPLLLKADAKVQIFSDIKETKTYCN